MAALFESMGDGVIVTDQIAHIRRINKVALEILGVSRDQVIGEWYPKVLVALDEQGKPLDAMNRPIMQALATGRAVTQHGLYKRRQGKPVAVATTVSPLIIGGRPAGAIEVFRDINQEYEIDKMKSEFISIASHQLRTPLSAVKTYAHLLSAGYQGKLSAAQQKFMRVIIASADRMNDLINVLLDVSRIEVGKLDVVIKPTNIPSWVKRLVAGLQTEAGARNVRLEYTASDQFSANIDRLLTGEVISNLLSNAIRYSRQGGTVQLCVDRNDGQLIFRVSDKGYGIPSAEQSRVFEKFFRADNARAREPSGTGLGLYMAKKIVDTLGGSIWFTSNDQGSTFFVQLPLNLAAGSQNHTRKKK